MRAVADTTGRRSSWRHGWRTLLRAGLLAFVAVANASAQTGATETAVKAAYVHKFLPFVDWPESALPPAGSPLVVGVVDAEPVRTELENFAAGRQVHNRPVQTRRIVEGDSLDGLHVLYVSRQSALSSWLKALNQRPVLVVSEGTASIDAGSMLGLIVVNGRLRFEASPLAADRVGLKLSSRLLSLADRVLTR